ncbi:protein unc-93 homolog A-like [Lingula anatina]|uniref:Protein unc-93 homolog A-like n=1 Tax=Lingula anatina TaxID=7574 RepID=A0A1S3I7E0_LINAN|nr:protein unc-93 homolog A-like [Lingula anatina]|eukprot:XP_013394118.1 protein unc-93 homolog A-like [Lingula anatina]
MATRTNVNEQRPQMEDEMYTKNPCSMHSNPQTCSRRVVRFAYLRLVGFSTVFVFVFTAWNGLQTLQSSLYSEHGLGLTVLTVGYSVSALGALFAPVLVEKIGCKKAIIAGICSAIGFFCANFYPRMYTLVPTVFVFGLLGNVLMTAASCFVTTLAIKAARASGREEDILISGFNGTFASFFKTTNIFGNLISWLVLKQSDHTGQNQSLDTKNDTFLYNVSQMQRTQDTTYTINVTVCSLYSDPSILRSLHSHASTQSPKPDKELVLLLVGVYVALSVTGAIGALFLIKEVDVHKDSTHEKPPPAKVTQVSQLRLSILSTILLLREFKMAALLPMIAWSAMHLGFLFAEFTKVGQLCCKDDGWVFL